MKRCLIPFFFILFVYPEGVYAQNNGNSLPAKKYSEKEKIEYLIRSVEKLQNAQFWRNGSYHDAKEAAEHLRMKWGKAGSRVKTAHDFINKIASESYLSGNPYRIKLGNGVEMQAKTFFLRKLKELETD